GEGWSEGGFVVDWQGDGAVGELGKARELGVNLVAARRETGDLELASIIGHRIAARSGAEILDDDGHAGQHAAGDVLDDAGDLSGAGLSPRKRRHEKKGRSASEK